MGGQEIWEFTGDSYNWDQEALKGEKILYTGQFKVKKKVALRVVSVSGRVDLTNGAVFYIMPGHWMNQCGIPPPKLERDKRRGRTWPRYAHDMSESAPSALRLMKRTGRWPSGGTEKRPGAKPSCLETGKLTDFRARGTGRPSTNSSR